MKKGKFLKGFLLCIKIILPVLILVPLIFFSYRLIEGRIESIASIGTQGYQDGMGLYIFLSHIFLLGMNVVLLVIGAIGLLISKKYAASLAQTKSIGFFRWLMIAPVMSQLLYIAITLIVMYIG